MAWWIFCALPMGALVSFAVVGVELKWFKLKGKFATTAVNYASGFFVGFAITCLVIILSGFLYFFGGTEYFPGVLADVVMPLLLVAMLAGLICGAIFGLLYAAMLRFLRLEPEA